MGGSLSLQTVPIAGFTVGRRMANEYGNVVYVQSDKIDLKTAEELVEKVFRNDAVRAIGVGKVVDVRAIVLPQMYIGEEPLAQYAWYHNEALPDQEDVGLKEPVETEHRWSYCGTFKT